MQPQYAMMPISDLVPADGLVYVLRERADHRLAKWSGERGSNPSDLGPLAFPSRFIADAYLKRVVRAAKQEDRWFVAEIDFSDLLTEADESGHSFVYFAGHRRQGAYLKADIKQFRAASNG